jgi:hypothetical protein
VRGGFGAAAERPSLAFGGALGVGARSGLKTTMMF